MRSAIERAGTAVVLTPEMRRGDFSAVSGAITDPLTGTPFPGQYHPGQPAESRVGEPDQPVHAAAERRRSSQLCGRDYQYRRYQSGHRAASITASARATRSSSTTSIRHGTSRTRN